MMIRKRKGFLLGTVLVAAAALQAEGVVWRPVSLDQLRAASNLIVIGEIVALIPGTPGPDCVDRAILEIERTLRGDAGADRVEVRFPGHKRGRLLAAGGVEIDRHPGLIRYELDQDGIFFLRLESDGTYTANHPARFKPRFFLSQVENALAGAPPGG
jgi:hypothetical protein